MVEGPWLGVKYVLLLHYINIWKGCCRLSISFTPGQSAKYPIGLCLWDFLKKVWHHLKNSVSYLAWNVIKVLTINSCIMEAFSKQCTLVQCSFILKLNWTNILLNPIARVKLPLVSRGRVRDEKLSCSPIFAFRAPLYLWSGSFLTHQKP